MVFTSIRLDRDFDPVSVRVENDALVVAVTRRSWTVDDGKTIALLTNDLERAALDIAALYKARWQIELLFRWIKQHLHIRRFLGNNDNAIRLQLFAAMIAYALLRLAARRHGVKISILRFTDLVALCLFQRRHLGAIDKPPPINPSRPQCQNAKNQLSFSYA